MQITKTKYRKEMKAVLKRFKLTHQSEALLLAMLANPVARRGREETLIPKAEALAAVGGSQADLVAAIFELQKSRSMTGDEMQPGFPILSRVSHLDTGHFIHYLVSSVFLEKALDIKRNTRG